MIMYGTKGDFIFEVVDVNRNRITVEWHDKGLRQAHFTPYQLEEWQKSGEVVFIGVL